MLQDFVLRNDKLASLFVLRNTHHDYGTSLAMTDKEALRLRSQLYDFVQDMNIIVFFAIMSSKPGLS